MDGDFDDSNKGRTTAEEEVLYDLQEDVLAMMQEAVQVVEPYLSMRALNWYALLCSALQMICATCVRLPCHLNKAMALLPLHSC